MSRLHVLCCGVVWSEPMVDRYIGEECMVPRIIDVVSCIEELTRGYKFVIQSNIDSLWVRQYIL